MIRNARLEDAKDLADIYNPYIVGTTYTFEYTAITAEEMRKRIEETIVKYPYLVYENENGKVIGYCYAHTWRPRAAFLHTCEVSIYLDQNSLGHGVGTQLYTELFKRLKLLGYHALVAGVTEENINSAKFHLKYGFKKVAHFEEVGWKFERWLGLDYYELILTT